MKELLPNVLKKDDRVKAFAELEKSSFEAITKKPPYIFIYNLKNLSDEELETLAWQLCITSTEWDLATTREQKEELIKNNILLKSKKGTKWAIGRVLGLLGLQGQVREWWEYNGKPYYFKVELGIENKEITPELKGKLLNLISDYKNERSWLEELILTYLSREEVFVNSGGVGEVSINSRMRDGYGWSCITFVNAFSGSIGEVSSSTQFKHTGVV
jgi:phage tail P2-like protein